MDADSLSSSSTVVDLSGGIFYDSAEEVTMAGRYHNSREDTIASFFSFFVWHLLKGFYFDD